MKSKEKLRASAETKILAFLGVWLLLILGVFTLTGEVGAGRFSGAAYGALVWIGAAIMLHVLRKLSPERNLQFVRGIIFIGSLQGLFSAVAVAAHPSPLSLIALPASRVMSDSSGGISAWLTARLAYTDYFGGGIVRSSGMMATAAWSGGFACLVLILLILGRKNLRNAGMSRFRWVIAVVLNLCSLTFSYSRVSWAILILTIAVYAVYCVCSPLIGGPALAGIVVSATLLVSMLTLPWQGLLLDQDSLRPGSSGTRFTSYGEGFDVAAGNGFFVLLAGNGAKPFIEALGRGAGSESTYVSMLVRGGIVAVVLFSLFVMVRIVRTYRMRDWTGLALVVAIAIHGVVEDLDVGTLTLLMVLIEPARVRLSRAGITQSMEKPKRITPYERRVSLIATNPESFARVSEASPPFRMTRR
jgi:hypothetical protein